MFHHPVHVFIAHEVNALRNVDSIEADRDAGALFKFKLPVDIVQKAVFSRRCVKPTGEVENASRFHPAQNTGFLQFHELRGRFQDKFPQRIESQFNIGDRCSRNQPDAFSCALK